MTHWYKKACGERVLQRMTGGPLPHAVPFVFVPAGSKITEIKDIGGMKLIMHSGPLHPYPPLNPMIIPVWISLFAVILSVVNLIFDIYWCHK